MRKQVAENPAVALGRKRWEGVSAADRSEQMSDLAKRAAKKMTKAQRVARAKKAVAAREAKRAAEKQ